MSFEVFKLNCVVILPTIIPFLFLSSFESKKKDYNIDKKIIVKRIVLNFEYYEECIDFTVIYFFF